MLMKIILILIFTTLLSGCINEGEIEEKVEPTPLIIYVPMATPEPTPEPTPIPTPKDLNLKIGDTVMTPNIKVCVYEGYTASSYVSNMHYEYPKDFHRWVIVRAKIKNLNNDAVYTGKDDFSMIDGSGMRYDPKYIGNTMESYKELYMNECMDNVMIFEVPSDTEKLKIQYNFASIFDNPNLAVWEGIDMGPERPTK